MCLRILIIFTCLYLFIDASVALAKTQLDGPYKATVLRIIDGDTIEARIHIWLDQYLIRLVRLDGINAPELRGKCDEEKYQAQQAKDYLNHLLINGSITLSNIQQDKYGGRIVARIHDNEQDISLRMIEAGHAVSYEGGRRTDWCKDELALKR